MNKISSPRAFTSSSPLSVLEPGLKASVSETPVHPAGPGAPTVQDLNSRKRLQELQQCHASLDYELDWRVLQAIPEDSQPAPSSLSENSPIPFNDELILVDNLHLRGEQQLREPLIREFSACAHSREDFAGFVGALTKKPDNSATAELLRQRALQGDYRWLPQLRFLEPSLLQGQDWSYRPELGAVYLNEQLLADGSAMQEAYRQAVGMHLSQSY